MKRLLLIVDMQSGMETTKYALEAVKQQIPLFRKHLFLAYEGYGEIHPELLALVKKPQIIIKPDNDGSREVIQWLKKKRYEPDEIVVCGVETCFCVEITAKKLSDKLPVSVLANATACSHLWMQYDYKEEEPEDRTNETCLTCLSVPVIQAA